MLYYFPKGYLIILPTGWKRTGWKRIARKLKGIPRYSLFMKL